MPAPVDQIVDEVAFPRIASVEMRERCNKQDGSGRDFQPVAIGPPGSPCGNSKKEQRPDVRCGPESRSRDQGTRVSRRKPQEDDSEADVAQQTVCGQTQHPF